MDATTRAELAKHHQENRDHGLEQAAERAASLGHDMREFRFTPIDDGMRYILAATCRRCDATAMVGLAGYPRQGPALDYHCLKPYTPAALAPVPAPPPARMEAEAPTLLRQPVLAIVPNPPSARVPVPVHANSTPQHA